MKEFILNFANDVKDMATAHPWKSAALVVLGFLIGYMAGAI